METIASRIYKPSDFSVGQVHEMLITLGRKGFSPEMATELANGQSGKAEQVVSIFSVVLDVSAILADWQSFYKNCFSWELDFSSVRIPERRTGFDRLIVVAKGLTPNLVYEVCDKQFSCWRYYDDLNSAIIHNDREPTEHYAVWVRDRVEADEEFKNFSAKQLQKKSIKGITLLERMVFGLKYWIETNKHLDIDNITLCAGSRYQDGSVPYVFWYGRHGGGVLVGYYDPDSSSDDLRTREVVSF